MSHLHPGRWARPRPLVLAALAAVAAVALPTVAGAAGSPSAAVSVAGAGQTAALRDNHVVVKLRAPAGSRVAVRAFARVGATTKPISWMRTASVGRSGTRSLTLPLSRGGRAILARCGVATPVSAAVTVKGRTLKSKWKTITADNRDCNRKPDTKVETITLPGETKTVTTPGPTVTEKLIEKVTETVTVTEPAPESPKEDLFRVGTAVKDISPTGPLYVGGYGAGYKVTGGVHDPLQARAFFVGHGEKAVVFVSVDAQGWFAGNQSPTGDDGQDAARAEAAAALAAEGYDTTGANIVLSATHTHAAPTLQGIWGSTDAAYMHQVKLAVVEAVKEAAADAQDAQLWSATGSIKGLVSQVQGTDQMAGFAVDTRTPVLWARKPGTGATVATYVTVPTHVDQYNPTAAGNNQFSADYPGYVREHLQDLLGGTSVVGVGTLGRQESIGASPAYDEVSAQGRFVVNAVTRALSDARKITDTTLAASRQDFTTVASNTGLLASMYCNHGDARFGCSEPAANNGNGTWFWPGGQIFTVNRSMTPPYYNAGSNLTNGTIGTSSSVARIGDQLYVTAPGEAFPEVASAIRRTFSATDEIRDVHVVNHGGDQLGYYWDQRPGVYPSAQLAQSDFERFNVGPGLAQDNVDAARGAASVIGLDGTVQHAYAEIDNPRAFSQPNIQFYSDRKETSDTTVSLYASSKKAQQPGATSTSVGSTAATQNDGKVSWDFGDGTTDVVTSNTRFDHTFPGAGAYRVQASVTDNLGMTYRWTQTVTINPPLTAGVDRSVDADGKLVLTPRAIGGQRWDVLAAHWTFDDGSPATDGTRIVRDVPATPLDVTVTVTDGAGNTDTRTVTIPAGG